MCILFIAIEQHQEYPLIIAANRDEFFNRPTRTSAFWDDYPHVMGGRDLVAGGTWMGLHRNGRLSALTNVRDPQRIDPNAVSRGELVSHFLTAETSASAYLNVLRETANQYNGYNLLFGDWHDLWVYNNHTDAAEQLTPGFYGLSNASLNSPWPKLNTGVKKLQAYCRQSGPLDSEHLFTLLRDDTQADDALLPETGVPVALEKALSSIFIRTEGYGTRTSTLLKINRKNQVLWEERTFAESNEITDVKNFQFDLI